MKLKELAKKHKCNILITKASREMLDSTRKRDRNPEAEEDMKLNKERRGKKSYLLTDKLTPVEATSCKWPQ